MSYTVAHLEDFVDRYLDFLIRKFRQPRRQAIVAALLEEAQELEDAIYDVLTGINLDDGKGAQLDLIGRILVIARKPGESDDDYKVRLLVEVLVRRSRGRAEDLLAIPATLFPTVYPCVVLREQDHATMYFQLLPEVERAYAVTIHRYLQRAAGAGVRVLLEYTPGYASRRFTLTAAAAHPNLDVDHGCSDNDDTSTGGLLTGIIG